MPSKTTVISIVSSKGGVGKTTIAANTSGLLAALNLRVLEIDAEGTVVLSISTHTASVSNDMRLHLTSIELIALAKRLIDAAYDIENGTTPNKGVSA